MKKYAFLAQLEERLAALPAQEREDALAYYEEYLEAAGKEQEEKAIAALGTPEEVAQKILEGEGIAAPAPEPPAGPAPAPQAPRPGGQPVPPAGGRPVPPPPPTPRPDEHPAPPAPPAGGPPRPGAHPEPPKPGEPAPPPPPPHPAAGPGPAPQPAPPAPAKGGQAWKVAAVIAVAVVLLAALALAFEYADDRDDHGAADMAPLPAQAGDAFGQPAQSAVADAAPDTAKNQGGAQAGGGTAYRVDQNDGTATIATAATELDLHVLYGDVTVTADDTVAQTTIDITGAEQGTFDVKQEGSGLELTDLRRGTADTTQVTVTVRVPASVREVDVEVGTGDITLAGALPAETSAAAGNGNIAAEDITVQELDTQTGNGDILLARIAPRGMRTAIEAETGTGDIQLAVIGSAADYELELQTGSGAITVDGQARAQGRYNRNAANELEALTGNGDITLTFSEP